MTSGFFRRQIPDFCFLAVTPLTLFKRFSTPQCKTKQSNTTIKPNIHLAFLQNFVACSEDTFAVSCYRTCNSSAYSCNTVSWVENLPHSCFQGVQKKHSWISTALSLPATVHAVPCVCVCRAVDKGCVEFVRSAKQRRCDHSCLNCTSAAVMSVNTTRGVGTYGGKAVNHSQQGRCTSQPKSVASS